MIILGFIMYVYVLNKVMLFFISVRFCCRMNICVIYYFKYYIILKMSFMFVFFILVFVIRVFVYFVMLWLFVSVCVVNRGKYLCDLGFDVVLW